MVRGRSSSWGLRISTNTSSLDNASSLLSDISDNRFGVIWSVGVETEVMTVCSVAVEFCWLTRVFLLVGGSG